ncbi:MAG: phosphoglycerate kinase [Bacteriovoracales bacterium]|nr:phosphoglycerate kinase [Bacteriovoracales bacterium]
MPLRYVDDCEEGRFLGRRVIARFDFNVPLQNGKIQDSSRIDCALPTIRTLLEAGVKGLVLMAHLGRPKGRVVEELSLAPIGDYLAQALKEEVILTESCLDGAISHLLSLPKTKIVLLENLRFHSGETENDPAFAKTLSKYGEIYVNDAFGACHREHASTYGINAYFEGRRYGGSLLKREVKSLGLLLGRPPEPFMAVVGGAKVSGKMAVLKTLLPKVEKLLIGGAMAYPFLKARGLGVGQGLCSARDVEQAAYLLGKDGGNKIEWPSDHLGQRAQAKGEEVKEGQEIPEDFTGFDIGPQTLARYGDILEKARTIFWNGPLGFFEEEDYRGGTLGMARILAASKAYTVVGGGDSVRAVALSGLSKEMDHLSTGGGAALEFIEKGESLPGIRALKFGPREFSKTPGKNLSTG